MQHLNLQKLCKQVCEVAKQAATFIATETGKVTHQDVVTKYHNNFVSYVDINTEKLIISLLKQLLPEAGYIGEENTQNPTESDYQWIIDPLDGTTNFLQNLPFYAVSIALTYKGNSIIGVVYEVSRNECFYAYKQGGAFLNDIPIKTSNCNALENAFVATGFPYYDFSILDDYMMLLKHLIHNCKSIRRIGAASLDLCYVACGRYDAYFEHSLCPWDVAAGSLIVQEAGGICTDFLGTNNYLFGREIVACNTPLQTIVLPLIKHHLAASSNN